MTLPTYKISIRPDNVVVLYFGDYDSPGCKMVKKLKSMLREYGIAFEPVELSQLTYDLENKSDITELLN